MATASVDGKHTQFWSRLGAPGRVGLLAGAALILAAAIGLIVWSSGSDYQVLFSQLAEADAATVVEQLKRQKIPYRLTEGGTTVKVPAEQVYETRLSLVSSGMPLSGGVGFELFDRQGVGATEQAQRVTYQRALQGELARTIGALNGVKYARVHLVLPESTVFKRDREDPRASVTLVLKPGGVLNREEVTGIQRLVAASVAGLDAAKVVITGQRGVTLSGAAETETGSTGSEIRLDVKRDIESYVARKIVALLDRAYGPGQALVSVDVALNFDEVKSTIQDVVPLRGAGNGSEGAVLRKRQVEMGATGSEAVSSEAGTAANNKAPTSTTEVEYEFGRRIEQVIAAPGSITRMSVGVVVPGALDEAKRERIVDLVRVAAGASSVRGDAIVVEPLDDFVTAGSTARSGPTTAATSDTERAEVSVTASKSAPVGLSRELRTPVVVGSLIAIALLLGLLVGRGVARRNKSLSYTERRQLVVELEKVLNARSAYSIGSEV